MTPTEESRVPSSDKPITVSPAGAEVQNRFTLLGPFKMLLNPIAQLINTIMDLIGLISVALSRQQLLL